MKKWQNLDQVTTPDGSVMSLHAHDGTYVIRVNGRELMSTRHFASEAKLAEVACARLATATAPSVLVGGLGLGFTLRAALKCLPKSARVTVAELMPKVVEWNKNPDYPFAAAELKDPRTNLVIDDVNSVIARSIQAFDAIMLDVDNGTTAMSTGENRRMYEDVGLAQVQAALKRDGVVVYWSAQQEPLFAKRMGRAGFVVDVQEARTHESSGGRHTLLIGKRR